MKSSKELKTLIPAALGLAALILDGNTAIEGAREGLDVCIKTVLPSLFPFLFLSSLLTSWFSSGNLIGNPALCRLYQIPHGADGILLTGLLGGYPVGAKCIGDAVATGQLSKTDGERMLIFCNAAGPSFLFGITGSIFCERWVPWCLWGIHLLSALCMARLLPAHPEKFNTGTSAASLPVSLRLRQSVLTMGEICGWIILMRTAIAMLQKWCLWYLPEPLQVLIPGLLELSNGCISLSEVGNTGWRFLLCSVFLGFGGLCVALQTRSAAAGLNQRMYLPGKCIQTLISFICAYTVQYFVFEPEQKADIPWLFFVAFFFLSIVFIYFRIKNKKSCGILESVGV